MTTLSLSLVTVFLRVAACDLGLACRPEPWRRRVTCDFVTHAHQSGDSLSPRHGSIVPAHLHHIATEFSLPVFVT